MTTQQPRRPTQWLVCEPPPTAHAVPPRSPRYARPANPATYATLRIQQRTSRSYETSSPPDNLASYLLDHGWRSAPISNTPHEYGRFTRGQALVICYWSGSVVIGGADSDQAAHLLSSLCEAAPANATMFDTLEDVDRGAE